MNTEVVATYYYDHHTTKADSLFEIVACYDSWHDYDNRNVSHYDIFDKTGICVNEGDPMYDFPTWDFVNKYYRSTTKA